MFNQSRADQAPFRDAGLVGLNQYMQMLGLGGNGSGQQYTGSGTGSGGLQYVSTNDQGIPVANAQLYASNPAYRQAWDSELAAHQKQWNMGYWDGSDQNKINGDIAAALGGTSGGVGTAGYETGTPANMGGNASLSPLGGGTAAPSAAQSQQDAFAAFRNTPGYQFGLDEGNKSVQASAAARGGLNSGATLKALQRYGNDYADQQGYTPYMNRLAALSGMAQTSTTTTGALGQQTANQIGQNTMAAGDARAQGIYGSANAWSNFANTAAKTAGNYFGGSGY